MALDHGTIKELLEIRQRATLDGNEAVVALADTALRLHHALLTLERTVERAERLAGREG